MSAIEAMNKKIQSGDKAKKVLKYCKKMEKYNTYLKELMEDEDMHRTIITTHINMLSNVVPDFKLRHGLINKKIIHPQLKGMIIRDFIINSTSKGASHYTYPMDFGNIMQPVSNPFAHTTSTIPPHPFSFGSSTSQAFGIPTPNIPPHPSSFGSSTSHSNNTGNSIPKPSGFTTPNDFWENGPNAPPANKDAKQEK